MQYSYISDLHKMEVNDTWGRSMKAVWSLPQALVLPQTHRNLKTHCHCQLGWVEMQAEPDSCQRTNPVTQTKINSINSNK